MFQQQASLIPDFAEIEYFCDHLLLPKVTRRSVFTRSVKLIEFQPVLGANLRWISVPFSWSHLPKLTPVAFHRYEINE